MNRTKRKFILPALRSRRAVIALGAVLFAIAFVHCLLVNPQLAIAGLAVLPFLGLVSPEADFQARVLKGVEAIDGKIGTLEKSTTDLTAKLTALETNGKATDGEIAKLKTAANEVAGQLVTLQRTQQAFKASRRSRVNGEVSIECARHLGGVAIALGLKTGTLKGDRYQGLAKDILGIEVKTALTSSDIPLPIEFSGEVVELVNQYGAARRYGTVFPLGAGTVKLPKLTTDTAFGLIAASGTVTEKSPQVGFVTFSAEKFGGLVRLPSEIDEDSIVPIGQFLARYGARNMAQVEDEVFFLNLDGSTFGAVKGLCGSTITNSKVEQLASTKTKYSDATLAKLRTLRAVVDASALRMGAYYMHPSFEQLLSTFNSAGDKPYNPIAQLGNAGQPFTSGPTLDGFPVRFVDKMPAYSTSANASKVFMLFGDLSFQYLGVRGGIRFDTSSEAGFETDEILVRALERFTIGLMANGAVAGLQTAAS